MLHFMLPCRSIVSYCSASHLPGSCLDSNGIENNVILLSVMTLVKVANEAVIMTILGGPTNYVCSICYSYVAKPARVGTNTRWYPSQKWKPKPRAICERPFWWLVSWMKPTHFMTWSQRASPTSTCPSILKGSQHPSLKTRESMRCSRVFQNEKFQQQFKEKLPMLASLERLYQVGVEMNRFQQEELRQCHGWWWLKWNTVMVFLD